MNFNTFLLSANTGVVNEFLHEILSLTANLFVTILEIIGVVILIYTSLKSFYRWIKKDPATKLNLLEGFGMALNFKLGGEILRTVVVRDIREILQVGAIIILRVMLTLLIHWEIKNEEEDMHGHKSGKK